MKGILHEYEDLITKKDSLLFLQLNFFSQVNINLENLKINYFCCELPLPWGHCGYSGTVIHVVQKPQLEHLFTVNDLFLLH